MAFGFSFGGSDSGKKGDGGTESAGKRSTEDGGSSSSDSLKSGDGGSDSVKRGEDMRSSSTAVGAGDHEGSGSSRSGVLLRTKHSSTERSVKEDEADSASNSSTNGSMSREGSTSSTVSEARKIQVKEAELEQAKLSAKDVHRRQEQVYGNFWSISPLRWATITGNMYALRKFRLQNLNSAEVRVEEGQEDANFLQLLNIVNEEGMNCLHLAANRGQCGELTHLLQHREVLSKSMVSMKEKIRHSAQLKSLQSLQREVDFEDVMSFMVSIPGVDLNAVDKKGNTPLLLASACGHLKAVEGLLEASAAMEIFNEEGLNCLHIAAAAGHSSVVDRIMQEAGLMDMGSFLNVKSRAETEWTALHYAVANSRIHTLELLLNYPYISVDEQDSEGCTPLILSCSLGYVPAVRILLRKGANKLIKNNAMANSSRVAAASGHVEVLKELTEHSNRPQEAPIACADGYGPSDRDTLVSEAHELESQNFWSTKSADVASSPSDVHVSRDVFEGQYRRGPSRIPYEFRRSEQILRSPAEMNVGVERSTVSLAVL